MKVYIKTSGYGRTTDIYFVIEDFKDEGKSVVARPIELVFEEVSDNKIAEPTLRLPNRVAKDFLTALSSALDQEGIKTENTHKLEGVLEAQGKHLEDMRNLVFKKSKK